MLVALCWMDECLERRGEQKWWFPRFLVFGFLDLLYGTEYRVWSIVLHAIYGGNTVTAHRCHVF